MLTEYKTVGVNDVRALEDHGDGLISAFVMVTGIEDNVKDVIHPGAASKSLTKRTPKGVWSHDWTRPISRTEGVQELPPGHPDLPKALSNGQPWPAEAGAYKVDTLFNMASPEGFRAYHDVKFFGDQQEWSIGYKVPEGGATYDKKTGVRHIHELDWFEYSPVLFGAMSHARTKMDDAAPSVARAQLAHKALNGIDISDIVAELKKWEAEGFGIEFKSDETAALEFKGDVVDPNADDEEEYDDEDNQESDDLEYDTDGDADYADDEFPEEEDTEDDTDIEDVGDDGYDEEDEEDYDEEPDVIAGKSGLSVDLIRETIANLEEIEEKMAAGGVDGESYDEEDDGEEDGYTEEEAKWLNYGSTAYLEAKAVKYDNVTEAIEEVDVPMSQTDAMALVAAATAFDSAVKSEDKAAAEQAATEILDVLEVLIKGQEGSAPSAATVARVMSDQLAMLDQEAATDDTESVAGNDDAAEQEQDEADQYKFVDEDGIEYKNVAYGDREFGFPAEVDTKAHVIGDDGVRAFIGGLGSPALGALDWYLEESDVDDDEMKSMVQEEVQQRIYEDDAELKGFLHGVRIRIAEHRRRNSTRPTPMPKKSAASKPHRPSAPVRPTSEEHRRRTSTRPTPRSSEGRAKIVAAVYSARHGGHSNYKSFADEVETGAIEFDEGKAVVRHMSAHWEKRGYRLGDTIGHPTGKKASPAKKAAKAAKKAVPEKPGQSKPGAFKAPTKSRERVDKMHAALTGKGGHDPKASATYLRHHAASRDAAHEHLLPKKMDELRGIADELGMGDYHRNLARNKTQLRSLIVEGSTGNRLDSQAIQRVFEETRKAKANPGADLRETRASLHRQVQGMIEDRQKYFDTLTSQQRRDHIAHDLSAVPTDLMRRQDQRDRQYQMLSHHYMGVISPEEFQNVHEDMVARGHAAPAEPRRRGMFRKDDEVGVEFKKQFSDERRAKLAKSGVAMDDGSFPIENIQDLKNAIKAAGRAKDKAAAQAHIKERAKKLNAEYLIPSEWGTKVLPGTGEVVDLTELKSLEEFIQAT